MSKYKLNSLALAIGMITVSQFASAEEQPESEQSSDNINEEVVVTGSRLKRSSFSTPMPIVGLSKDDIESVGTNSLTDAVLEIPSVVSGLSQTNTTSSLQNAGISSVDLRNLGDNRTLVLIDGRRTVSNSGNGNRVSLGTIPTAFVERVEVITGGASAVYGSDAVAGVVNIITESNQEGLELDLRYGQGRSGNFDNETIDLSYGTRFGNDKGYFFAALNYDSESGLRAQDVDRSTLEASWRYRGGQNQFETINGFRPASEFSMDGFRQTPGGAVEPFANRSSDPDGGRFNGSSFWFDDSGVQTGFVTNRDGFNFQNDDDILIPRDRLNLAFKANYELADGTEAYAQLIYSDVETDNLREPEGDDFNDLHTLFDFASGTSTLVTAGRIPLTNPFVPAEIAAASSGDISWDRRFVEVGLQRTVNNRETTRFWAGLKGTFSNDWEWDASIGYGEYEQNQVRFNEINILNLTQGLNAEVGPDGQIRCADATARANGCVPVNLFGRGSITPEAADFIRANLALDATVEQINVLAFTRGTLFDLPAGSVDAAFGIEYRKDEQVVSPGELNRTGGHSSNFVPAYSGETDVLELFAETSIPLLTGVPGAQSLSLDLSLRYADYSQENVGGVTSFGTGLQWRPIDELNIRTSFNRALRAPDLTELFSPPRGDSDSFSDICDGITLADTGLVAENCRAEAGVLANITANGAFDDENSGKFSPNAGNSTLKEESADTLTFGFVWQPDFLPGFSIASDYYNIEIDDAIDSFTNEEILRQCYESPNFGPDNSFCQVITRDGDGQIAELIQQEFNLDTLETSGIDTTARYTFGLDSLVPGDFTISYIHSHLIKYRITAQGVDDVVVTDERGELDGRETFEDRARIRLSWNYDNLSVSWRTRYFGSVDDSNGDREDYLEALAADPAAEKPFFLDIGREFIHDVNMSYEFEGSSDSTYRIYAGIRNVLDNDGPFLPSGTTGGADNSNDVYGTARGRFPYIGINARF